MQQPSQSSESRNGMAPQLLSDPFLNLSVIPAGLDSRFQSPSASKWILSRARRTLDAMIALTILLFFALPMLAIAVCVRLNSRGPVLFVQRRVGRAGRLFRIYKFRSMAATSGGSGPGLTREGDLRVTSLGRWLRKLKLDELPQFYNVLRGDMSLVGPRPKLPQYAAILNMPYRPGITGAATLAFRREEEILSRVHPSQVENFYHQRIKPLKARIDIRYMCRATPASDLRLVAATILACLRPARVSSGLRNPSAHPLAFPSLDLAEPNGAKSFEAAN